MRAQDEEAERERDVRDDDGDGAAAGVGRERAPGAGDAGGEDGALGHRHLLGAHGDGGGDERAERGDGGEARPGDGARGAREGEQLKDERELIAERRGVGHRLDVHGQQRPQRRGGERGRAIAGDDAQHERGDERDGERRRARG